MAASADAILEPTIQVLFELGLELGKERLTTTRVAMQADVSVGTLYQYSLGRSMLPGLPGSGSV